MPTTIAFAHGKHLAAARTLAGLTQRELAKRADLHVNTTKYWERRTGPLAGQAPERFAFVLAELGITASLKGGRAELKA